MAQKTTITVTDWYTEDRVSFDINVGAVTDPGKGMQFINTSAYDVPGGPTSSAITEIDVSGGAKGGSAPYIFTKASGPDWLKVDPYGKLSGKRPDDEQIATTAEIRVQDANLAMKTITIKVGMVGQYDVKNLLSLRSGKADYTSAGDGQVVEITADAPPEGKVFDKWTASEDVYFEDAKSAATTFIMTDKNVVITAEYKDGEENSMSNFNKVRKYTPGMFVDVNEGAWYGYNEQKTVANAYEYGLMNGKNDGRFDPTGNMLISEAITVAARVHSIYATGSENFKQGDPWYQVYIDYAIKNGIIKSGDFPDYSKKATRAEMAYIFSRALPEEEFPPLNTVNAVSDVTSATPYRESILTLYKAGIVEGSGENRAYNPANNVTRAEAAAIIARVILPETRKRGKTYG